MKAKLLAVIVVLFFVFPLVGNVGSVSPPPVLSVVKTVEKKVVRVGDPFYIYIDISNVSNQTAYNVTLVDDYPDWSFEVLDHGAVYWPFIAPNETVHTYIVLRVKNYVSSRINLGYATVVYYDEDGVKYSSISDDLEIYLAYYHAKSVDTAAVWKNVSIGLALIFLLIVAPLILLEYRFYLSYKRESAR
ncbi:MAG: hypothetical protein ACP6IP_00455 [Candidatus Njordarchaeia archaeon]